MATGTNIHTEKNSHWIPNQCTLTAEVYSNEFCIKKTSNLSKYMLCFTIRAFTVNKPNLYNYVSHSTGYLEYVIHCFGFYCNYSTAANRYSDQIVRWKPAKCSTKLMSVLSEQNKSISLWHEAINTFTELQFQLLPKHQKLKKM